MTCSYFQLVSQTMVSVWTVLQLDKKLLDQLRFIKFTKNHSKLLTKTDSFQGLKKSSLVENGVNHTCKELITQNKILSRGSWLQSKIIF